MATLVPSAEIPVPPFATGRIPVTSAVRLTAEYVGDPAALPWRTVVVVPFAPCTIAVPLLITILLPDNAVPELVPPFATGRIPVTSAVRLTALHVGNTGLPCST